MSSNLINDVLGRVRDALPEAPAELRSRVDDVLRKSLAHLDLVSRADFEQQTRRLERLQSRLESMEARLRELNR